MPQTQQGTDAEKTNLARTHTQRPVPYPISPQFIAPDLKHALAAGLDVPDSAPADIRPSVTCKSCKCGQGYDEKDMFVISEPAVLYQLGPATKKVSLWAVNCPMKREECTIVGTGETHQLQVLTDDLVISDSLFYDTLNSVNLTRWLCAHFLCSNTYSAVQCPLGTKFRNCGIRLAASQSLLYLTTPTTSITWPGVHVLSLRLTSSAAVRYASSNRKLCPWMVSEVVSMLSEQRLRSNVFVDRR
jgi:hypothetical protein